MGNICKFCQLVKIFQNFLFTNTNYYNIIQSCDKERFSIFQMFQILIVRNLLRVVKRRSRPSLWNTVSIFTQMSRTNLAKCCYGYRILSWRAFVGRNSYIVNIYREKFLSTPYLWRCYIQRKNSELINIYSYNIYIFLKSAIYMREKGTWADGHLLKLGLHVR